MRFVLAAVMMAMTAIFPADVRATSREVLELDIYGDSDFHALYPPFGGYARAYGRCYEVLLGLQPLYAAFFDTDEGRAVRETLNPFDDDRVEFDRISCPFHWDRKDESFKQQCLDLKSRVELAWSSFKTSTVWEQATQTQSLKEAFAGYDKFCDCMGGR